MDLRTTGTGGSGGPRRRDGSIWMVDTFSGEALLDAGRGQTPCNAVLTDLQNTFQKFVFPPRKSFKEHLQARFAADLVVQGEASAKVPNADVDAWLMGSNPMNPIVRRAMGFYFQE